MTEILINEMTAADWNAVSEIYHQGIDTGNATFAQSPPGSWEEWCKSKINPLSLVARQDGVVIGWAALSSTSNRCVYAGVAEVSIYVSSCARGRGTASQLLGALIHRSEANGIWTLQAMIFPENQASLDIHYDHGFRKVGVREKIGRMEYGQYQGKWRDVILLERRSIITGVD